MSDNTQANGSFDSGLDSQWPSEQPWSYPQLNDPQPANSYQASSSSDITATGDHLRPQCQPRRRSEDQRAGLVAHSRRQEAAPRFILPRPTSTLPPTGAPSPQSPSRRMPANIRLALADLKSHMLPRPSSMHQALPHDVWRAYGFEQSACGFDCPSAAQLLVMPPEIREEFIEWLVAVSIPVHGRRRRLSLRHAEDRARYLAQQSIDIAKRCESDIFDSAKGRERKFHFARRNRVHVAN